MNKLKGFTITELIIVIAVIGILASIGIVSYSGYRQRAEKTAADSTAQQVKLKLGEYFTDKNRYPANSTDVNSYLTSIGATTLAADFTAIISAGGTYQGLPQSPTPCTTTTTPICTSYSITIPQSYWNGTDGNITVSP